MTPRTAKPYAALHGGLAWLLEGGDLPARQIAAPTEEAARRIDAVKERLARQTREAAEEIERIREGG